MKKMRTSLGRERVFFSKCFDQLRVYGGMYLPPYFFLQQHIIFSNNIVLRTWCTTQYFLKK